MSAIDKPTAPPGADDAAAEAHLERLNAIDAEPTRSRRAGLIHDLAVEYFSRTSEETAA